MKHPLLDIQKIGKIYNTSYKKLEALKDVSFNIVDGEIFSLLGVNGAGKTTLSSIIATLIKPTAGDVLFKGKSIYKQLLSFRENLGFCPQKQNLDTSITLEHNLIFAGRYFGFSIGEIQKRKDYLLDKFNLKLYAKEKAHVLSGGYRQRFLIARTLMHFPKLIILDEPTVGLDPKVRNELVSFIASLKKEKVTILLTTHYLDEAEKISDRVCVIDDGKIKVIDSPKKLKTDWKKKNLEDVFLHLLKEKEQ